MTAAGAVGRAKGKRFLAVYGRESVFTSSTRACIPREEGSKSEKPNRHCFVMINS